MNIKSVAVCSLLVATVANSAAVTIVENDFQALLVEGGSPVAAQYYTGTTLPVTTTLHNFRNGSSTQIDIEQLGFGDDVTFHYGLNQVLEGDRRLYLDLSSIFAITKFTVDSVTTYDISGQVSRASASGALAFTAILTDVTNATTLLYTEQLTGSAGALELGGSGGNPSYLINTGSLTGTLFPGVVYQFTAKSGMFYGHSNDDEAVTGDVTLKIGGGAAVPDDGATGLQVGLCLIAFGCLRRKFQTAAGLRSSLE